MPSVPTVTKEMDTTYDVVPSEDSLTTTSGTILHNQITTPTQKKKLEQMTTKQHTPYHTKLDSWLNTPETITSTTMMDPLSPTVGLVSPASSTTSTSFDSLLSPISEIRFSTLSSLCTPTSAPLTPISTINAAVPYQDEIIKPLIEPPQAVCAPLPPPPQPFIFAQRFCVQKVLTKTIYGHLNLSKDRSNDENVVVKVSEKSKMQQKHHGSEVQEDVRKEAIVMRTLGLTKQLGEEKKRSLTSRHIDTRTTGLSDGFLRRNTVAPGASDITPQALEDLSEGAKFISHLLGEYETPLAHYLATEHAPRGDLYNVLTESAKDGTNVTNEVQARKWFKQLCQAVQYLHAQSVAHLDLSVENVCIDANDDIRLIDFGLAAKHPLSQSETFGGPNDIVHNTGYLSNDIFFAPKHHCNCGACFSSTEQLRQRADAQIQGCLDRYPAFSQARIADAPLVEESIKLPIEQPMEVDSGDARIPSQFQTRMVQQAPKKILEESCRFMMRPVCRNYCKPGKLSYMSPELTDPKDLHQPFDAYKADCFSLGVILFILVTGVPPFVKANESSDIWFRWFATGEWMESRRYFQPVAKHYTGLSPNCWNLIDALFKPQHLRLSIDEILDHPWFNEAHPLSQPIDRLKNRQ